MKSFNLEHASKYSQCIRKNDCSKKDEMFERCFAMSNENSRLNINPVPGIKTFCLKKKNHKNISKTL